MKSQMLGSVILDPDRLTADLAALREAPPPDGYSEYIFGQWRDYVLANGTGDQIDNRFRPHHERLAVTDLGRRMPYVLSLVERHFDRRLLKWVRLFTVQDALLVTHRDYLEFKQTFRRIHLVLDTDETCLHSEQDDVFHMRRGEIWFLDGTTIHAACTLSEYRRVSLVLDFEDDGAQLSSLLKADVSNPSSPMLLRLPALTDQEYAAIVGLRAIATRENFRDMIGLLGKIHFYRKAGAASVFDWLADIYRDDPVMAGRAHAYRNFCIDRRGYQERFDQDAN